MLYMTRMTQTKKMTQQTQYCRMVVLLTKIVVYSFLLHDFHIWSCVPGSAKGR